jgi:hypothetical protein
MDMASQGQAVGRQSYRWFEPLVVALAVAAIMITLVWGAITALSAPSTVAPERTTIQMLQEPGLLDQRSGERGGPQVTTGGILYTGIPTVPSLITDPTDGLVEHRRGERGGPQVNSGGMVYTGIPSVPNVVSGPTDGLVEHRRGERGGSVSAPVDDPTVGLMEHRRGEREFD